jgi:oxygen-independent coproporphyrinogen III oxidase
MKHIALALTPAVEEVLQKYSVRGPRYTSYPTAPIWTEAFTGDDYAAALRQNNTVAQRDKPLALYVHIPFCESRCTYCSCNVIITKQTEQAEKYLAGLLQEIDMAAEFVLPTRPVLQLHLGGGTPTYFTANQLETLVKHFKKRFHFSEQAELAIEIDPRVTSDEQLDTLKNLGFNRISFGVQDFDPIVQAAVNRIQPIEQVAQMAQRCRDLGIENQNYDLIYGLPYQSLASFDRTLDEVITLSPSRIALYNYAHVPWMSPHQKEIDEATLPDGTVKFQIFSRSLSRLQEAGYVYIGMDHFAKPDDELSLALAQKRLSRNFMGYYVQHGADPLGELDMVSFGVSAISSVHGTYSQATKKLSTYYEALANRQFPIQRGYILHADDTLRRRIILSILCEGHLSCRQILNDCQVDISSMLSLESLKAFVDDGLIVLTDEGFTITPLGRVLSRNIAMVFDAYLKQPLQGETSPVYSKTV